MQGIIDSFNVLANVFPLNLLLFTQMGRTLLVFAVGFWLMLKIDEYQGRK